MPTAACDKPAPQLEQDAPIVELDDIGRRERGRAWLLLIVFSLCVWLAIGTLAVRILG